MAIPTRYRAALVERGGGRMVLTADISRNLMLYAQPDWDVLERKVMALPSLHPDSRRMQRLLVGYATDVEMDSAHRILIPQTLRDYAGMSKQLVMLGQGSRFELWDETQWHAETASWAEAGPPDPTVLQQLNEFSM